MKRPDLYREWIAAEACDRVTMCMPTDVVPEVAKYVTRKQEHFIIVALNGAHEIIGHKVVTIGLVNRTLVHPREVFRYAIVKNATAIVLVHNHPSGNLEPSEDDDAITRRLVESGQVLGIPVLDHVIIANTGYFSYLENDRL